MSFFRRFPKTTYDFEGRGLQTEVTDIFRYVRINDLRYIDSLQIYTYYDIQDGERPDVVSAKLYSNRPEFYWTFFLLNDHLRQCQQGWPMNYLELEKYLAEKYPGIALLTQTPLGKIFAIGDKLYQTGNFALPYGTLIDKNAQLGQLFVDVEYGTFNVGQNISKRTNTTEPPTFGTVVVVPYEIINDASLAAHHYETDDGRISYNANFITETSPDPDALDTNLTPITYREYETRLNDARSRIRVIQPEYIFEFTRDFTRILNA
jgi:hypothetical protein